LNERPQFRLERLQELHRQRAGKVIPPSIGSRNIGRHGPEEPVADVEDEGRGAVDNARGDDPATGGEMVVAVVAGAGLAADIELGAPAILIRAAKAMRCRW